MVPPGYRFKPTDAELMRYLEAFVVGKPVEHTSEFIRVEDFYGGREPWEIFGTGFGEPIRYYFTELKRKCQTGSRFLRRVGDGGTWKGQDRGLPICDKTKTVMGFKKSLKYECKRSRKEQGADEHGVWLMKEYSLSDDYLRGKKVVYKNFVLCRIKKEVRKTSRNQFKNDTQNVHETDTLEAFEWDDEVTMGMSFTPPPSENSNSIIDYDNNNNHSGQTNHHHKETMVNTKEMASTSSNMINNNNNNQSGLIGPADHQGVIGSNTWMIEGDGILLDDDLLRLLMTNPPSDPTLDDFFFGQ